MARALKFQSGLGKEYWGDCVLTSVHIMNMLPSYVLNKKSPYKVLYHKRPPYEDLKSFSCLAFVANLCVHMDKLEARGAPCIFLGYPPTQKGFKLLNIVDKTVFISRDVCFRENIFPFNKISGGDVYLQLLHVSMPSPQSLATYDLFDFAHVTDSIDISQNQGTSQSQQSAAEDQTDSVENQNFDTASWRSSRVRKQPVWMDSYVPNLVEAPMQSVSSAIDQPIESNFACFLTSVTTQADPVSFKQAVYQQH